MIREILLVSALVINLVSNDGLLFAEDSDPTQDRDRIQERDQEQIYGSQLMTPQERTEHRSKMRAAKTAEEREQIRKEHHERMKVRAKERGVTLPDDPPATRGGGMMGPGGGMGSGGGGGRNR